MKKNFIVMCSALCLLLTGCNESADCNACAGNIDQASNRTKEIIKYIQQDGINVFGVTEMSSKGTFCQSFEEKQNIHNIYSLSKNFTSMTFGTLLDEGAVSVDENIYSIFSSDYPQMSEVWKNVTIDNVLTQTTGITSGFLDVDQDDIKSFGDDYLKYTLDHVPTETPGTVFQYSDSNYYLISSIIKKKTGKNTQDLIKERIFKPLEITDYDFVTDTKGNFMGATGLFLNSVEVAKFGYMLLNYGKYNDQQIVSTDYVFDAVSKKVETGGGTYYGYSIWSNVASNSFYGNGMLGQYMFMDLSRKMVTSIISEDGIGLSSELFDILIS